MLSRALCFVFFLGFVGASCSDPTQEREAPHTKREAATAPSAPPVSLPASCALVFSEGEWQISKAQAKQLRQSPQDLGAAASLHTLGVKLDSVAAGGLASCVGLRAGDVLASVGAVSLMSPLEAISRLDAALSMGGVWTLRYWRGASLYKLKIRVVD